MVISVLTNCTAACLTTGETPYDLIENAAIVLDGKTIAWVGSAADLPPEYATAKKHDQNGALVTPALIDCHTHIVWGGNRAREFEMRLNGAGYEEIARAGGGILSTVTATRDASLKFLIDSALPRVDTLIAEGMTTIEIKSGYGLDLETELKMLRAARTVGCGWTEFALKLSFHADEKEATIGPADMRMMRCSSRATAP